MKFDSRKTLAGYFISFLHNFFMAGKFAGKNVRSGVNGLIRSTFSKKKLFLPIIKLFDNLFIKFVYKN